MAASWNDGEYRRKNSLPDNPSPGSDPTSQRDACVAGAPPPAVYAGEAAPDNQHPTTSLLEPDASRTLPSTLARAIVLLNDLAALNVCGPFGLQVGFVCVERAVFDALDGSETVQYDRKTGEPMWRKTVRSDASLYFSVSTRHAPVETEAAA